MTVPTTVDFPSAADNDLTLVFLETLLGQKPADAHLLVWTLPNKLSRSFTSATDAYRYILSVRDKFDVYLGVGLSNAPVEHAARRFNAQQVSAIYAVWADVDIADPAHKKANLPPNVDEAIKLVRDTGLMPTMIVHTGHGIQAWWVLDEPWVFEDGERANVMKVVTDWLYGIKARAKLRGNWEVDSTQDLARVLRVAGTTNRKSEHVPVRILELNTHARYTVNEIAQAAAEAPVDVTTTTATVLKVQEATVNSRALARQLRIDPAASQPTDKWHHLTQTNERAESVMTHARGRKNASASASECDFALACMAIEDVDGEWTPQEITDLLIAHRRLMHNATLAGKLRPDYYALTIERARAEVLSNAATDELGEWWQQEEARLLEAQQRAETERGAKSANNVTAFPQATTTFAATVTEPTEPTPPAGPRKATVAMDPRYARMLARDYMNDIDPEDASLAGDDGEDDAASDDAGDVNDDETPDSDDEAANALLSSLHHGANVGRALAGLSEALKHFQVLRVTKMIATPPLFGIEIRLTETGKVLKINLGTIDGLMSFRQFRSTVAAYSGKVIDPKKPAKWDNIVRTMLAIAEIEDIGKEATEEGQVHAWVDFYLFRHGVDRSWDRVPPNEGAFFYAQHVHITSRHFEHWLRTSEMEKISMRDIGKMLRSIGAETATVPYFKDNGARTTMSTWRLPDELVEEYLSGPKAMTEGE